MFDEFAAFFDSLSTPITIPEAVTAIGFSLLASIVTYLMYQFFYGSRYIGAGVHRTFLIGGPAVTTLFLGIQVSIPLSLGLLGALSFVRFRTPVKDPAEIGFLLLLIAASIGAATSNYLVTIILYILVFIVLLVQWLIRNRFNVFGRGNLVISVDESAFPELEEKLNSFLSENLGGLRLSTMSILDNRVSLTYQYRRKSGNRWTSFITQLKELSTESNMEIFIG